MRWLAFDLDGTLIDARHRQVEVTAWMIGQHGGGTLDRTRFWRFKRGGMNTAAALARLGYGTDLVETVARGWPDQMETDLWLDQDRALPGVTRVLGRLRADGARIAVITARRRAEGAKRSLAAAHLSDFVDDVSAVAPAEAAAAKARRLRELGAEWFVGDTDSDGTAARAAGVPFVAVSTGQRSGGWLQALGYQPAGSLHAAVARLCV